MLNLVRWMIGGRWVARITALAGSAFIWSVLALVVNTGVVHGQVSEITPRMVSPVNGHTYVLLSQANWAASEAMAVSMGGHLATIRNKAENDWVFATFTDNGTKTLRALWIGLTDQATEGTFVWTSGERIIYSNWASGEPNNADPGEPQGEDCVVMDYAATGKPPGTWNDRRCALHPSLQMHGVVEITSGCSVPEITPPIPDVLLYENAAPNAPTFSLYWEFVDQTLDLLVGRLETEMSIRRIPGRRESGHRPFAYQSHLYNIRQIDERLQTEGFATPEPVKVNERVRFLQPTGSQCSERIQQVNDEINRHRIVRGGSGWLSVADPNVPNNARHIALPAEAVDMSGIREADQAAVAEIASSLDLYQPYPVDDPVHFERSFGVVSARGNIVATARSPIRMLLRDPLGRRIGFDTTTGVFVNEISGGASYRGTPPHPQLIDIAVALPGQYTLTGVGIGSGSFSLALERVDEHGIAIDVQQQSGTIVSGHSLSLGLASPVYIPVDVKPDDKVNIINPRAQGVVPVAILSTALFNAPAAIRPQTLTFGRTGDESSFARATVTDVNRDGRPDLLCHFSIPRAMFAVGNTRATLKGKTNTGIDIVGSDWIRLISH